MIRLAERRCTVSSLRVLDFVCGSQMMLFALFSLLNGFVKASNDSPGTLVLAQVVSISQFVVLVLSFSNLLHF